MLATKNAGTLVKSGSPQRPSMNEQVVRAMSFNGFALFAIFLGATTGYIIFSTDTLKTSASEEMKGVTITGTSCD
ncbi:transmembrane protein, putative, partial [Rhizoctonia solani AG-3 Rhs1AP]